jgi:Beta xylosidase C-terminal Concanavalin A-like domain
LDRQCDVVVAVNRVPRNENPNSWCGRELQNRPHALIGWTIVTPLPWKLTDCRQFTPIFESPPFGAGPKRPPVQRQAPAPREYPSLASLEQSASNRLATLPEASEIGLQVRVVDAKLRFFYRSNGDQWTDLGLEKDFTKLSDEYATPIGFTGAFAGITVNDMLGFREPADFRSLSYTQLNG